MNKKIKYFTTFNMLCFDMKAQWLYSELRVFFIHVIFEQIYSRYENNLFKLQKLFTTASAAHYMML